MPDGRGSLLLLRYLEPKGIDVSRLTVLQRLALVGTKGRGVVKYYPDSSIRAGIDPPGVGKIEYDYAQLAGRCGINMPETRLFENKYFATERFDHSQQGKVHTISAAGLLHANYRIPSLDYSVLLKLCLHFTKNMEEVKALFRQMVFNVVISNRDDHAKNFSFQYVGNHWQLSPAYDLLPSAGFNGFHTTTINNQGNPTLKDILQVGTEAGIPQKQVQQTVEEIVETCMKNAMGKYAFM